MTTHSDTTRSDPASTSCDLPVLVDDAAEKLRAALHLRRDELSVNDLYRTVGSLDRLIARAADVADHLAAQLPARRDAVEIYHDEGADPAAAVAAIVDQLELTAQRLRTIATTTRAHNAISHLGERYSGDDPAD